MSVRKGEKISALLDSIQKASNGFSCKYIQDNNEDQLALDFNSFELPIVLTFKHILAAQVERFGSICGASVVNARGLTYRYHIRLAKVKEIKNPCTRCGGSGRMPYSVKGGICFKCNGKGKAK